MNAVVLFGILAASIAVMATWGIARTFVFVWLPAMLFFFLAPPVRLPGLPNLVAPTAVGYAVILLAPVCWREIARLRINVLDIVIILLMIPPTMSVLLNNTLWDAISRTGDLFFRWILPYFMARIAFTDPAARKPMLTVVCVSTIILGSMAVLETRLWPYFVSRTMERYNLAKTPNEQVFKRFGLMRAQTTLGHPIDLGNCGVILGSMVLMLTPIAGRRWNDRLPLAATLAAGAMVVAAVSFTGVVATAFAFVLFYAFTRQRAGPKLVFPAVLLVMFAIAMLMYQMLQREISTERPTDTLEASVWIRTKIVQEGWAKAESAGLFGEGQYIDTEGIGTGSIDNAYILFVLMFGWAYLLSWIILALVVGVRGAQTMALTRTLNERVPVAAVCAGTIAVFLAMYTVFYGFVYAMLILAMMGFLSSMWQIFNEREAVVPQGFAPMPPAGAIPYATPVGGPR